MKWDQTLSVGIDAIDNQHRRLIDYISTLEDAVFNRSRESVGEVIASMIDYTVTHFAFEEALMERAGYKILPHHKKVHDDFAKRMLDYQRRFAAGEDITRKLLSDLRIWLTNHIKRDDKDYAPVVRDILEEGWLGKTLRKFFG
jgi:hemerythrin